MLKALMSAVLAGLILMSKTVDSRDLQKSSLNSVLLGSHLDVFANSDKNDNNPLFTKKQDNAPLFRRLAERSASVVLAQTCDYVISFLGNLTNPYTDSFKILPDAVDSCARTRGKNGEEQCATDLKQVFNGFTNGEMWARRMLDASGKPLTGILKGATIFVGNFDECLDIEYRASQDKTSSHVIRGNYCRLVFKVQALVPVTKMMPTGSESSLQWHVCIPASCTADNIKAALNYSYPTKWNTTLDSVSCRNRKSIGEDGSAIGALVVIGAITLLSCVGTLYDIVSTQMKRTGSNVKLSANAGEHPESSSATTDPHPKQKDIVSSGKTMPEIPNEVATGSDIKAINNQAGCEEYAPRMESDKKETKYTDGKRAKYGIGRKLLLCFSLLKNTEKIFGTGTSGGNLGCLHGIRVFSMAWIVLAHTFSVGGALRAAANKFEVYGKIARTFSFQAVINSSLSVDTFFLMSGCLVTLLFLRETDKLGKVKCRQMILYYVHRYWRLTPLYIISLMVYACLTAYMTDGPLDSGVEYDRPNCFANWWINMLYINNIYMVTKGCMAWTWFLADDMQFYVIAPLAMVPLALGFTVLGFLVIAIFLGTHIITYAYFDSRIDGPTLLDPDNALRYYFMVYIMPYCRVGVFAIGIILGYILHKTKCRVKISKLILMIGSLVALSIALTCTYVTYQQWTSGAHEWDTATRTVYETLFRPAWVLAVSWVIFVCCTGYGGLVNRFLSWKAWIPLGRLTYAVYLVHPLVLAVALGNMRTLPYITKTSIGHQFISTLVISYAIAYIFAVLVEAPCLSLEKAVLKR